MTKSLHDDLLIEIGCEELPAENLSAMSTQFKILMEAKLKESNLSYAEVRPFASPRRLALLISALSLKQPDAVVVKKGPRFEVAFDKNNQPTPIGKGFAEACGAPIETIKVVETAQGRQLVFEQAKEGSLTADLIPQLLKDILHKIPFPKRMRWGSSTESFIRPVHWVVLLLGEQALKAHFFGIEANNITYGHRFLDPKAIHLHHPKEYEEKLLKAHVIADFHTRKTTIQQGIQKKLESLNKNYYALPLTESFESELVGLVEWPEILLGTFEQTFLSLPKEVLIAAMQFHQKCIPVLNQDRQNLAPHFIIVGNIPDKDGLVVKGNNTVMHARLADAAFHYKVDLETSLEARTEILKTIVFQKGLGNLWDKSERIKKLAETIAKTIRGDLKTTLRAGALCKADLLTQMVGEFPELQGVMGYYYALLDKESPEVAISIREHYYPRFAADSLPETKEGASLAIADRLDTLVGLFMLGKQPTGDSDPFSLRRQALGILRILIEKKYSPFNLSETINNAINNYVVENLFQNFTEEKKNTLRTSLMDFFYDRLRSLSLDQGITAQMFEAVLAKRPLDPYDFHQRLMAVHHFSQLPEAESLSAANKRVKNILNKEVAAKGISINPALSKDLFQLPQEKLLFEVVFQKQQEITPLLKSGHYTEALMSLSTLKEPIDQFFNEVMVMVDDMPLRNNRIALLNQVRQLFLEIADISLL